MVQPLLDLLKSVRPRQAFKNLALFSPLIFSGDLFVWEKFLTVLWSAFLFTILTSSVYLLNDVIDLSQDQLHPFKKKRPIAAGRLPISTALFFATVGLFVSLFLARLQNPFFFLTALAYFFLQLAYTLNLKNIIIMDVIAIAGGFILRVYAGAFAINVHMNVWFLLCVVSLALFLSVGKRRAELAILDEKAAPRHRKTLSFYSAELLDSYLAMFANSAWLAYALFAFFAPPPPISQTLPFMAYLPLTLAGINKWLMITIPIVIYGIMRYLHIIYQGNRAESPERVLFTDKPLLTAIVLWGIAVIVILYGIRP